MPIIGPPFQSWPEPKMDRAKQVAVAAELFPTVARFFRDHPNGFDPLNDLNAVHEIEKFFTGTQRDEYRSMLSQICGGLGEAVSASAQQRLEAILRVRQRWQE